MTSCETMFSPMKINQTEVNNMEGLLQYIEQVDQSVADAEVNVLESLIQSYDKAIAIIQESEDDTDLSAFDIFQEGEKWDKFKEDTKAPVLGNKGEGAIKRILMALPRLIQKLIALIKKLFTKNKTVEKQMDKDIKDLKDLGKKEVHVNNNKEEDESDPEKRFNDWLKRTDEMEAEEKRIDRKLRGPQEEIDRKATEELRKNLAEDVRKLENTIVTITRTKFFSDNGSTLYSFNHPSGRLENSKNKFVMAFGIDFQILQRRIFDEVPSDPKDFSQFDKFNKEIEEWLIPTVDDAIKRLRMPFAFNGTIKVKYFDLVEVLESMESDMKFILHEIRSCIDKINKLQPGIKKQVEEWTNKAIDGSVFYYKYDHEINCLNANMQLLWKAIESLTKYHDTIKQIWDEHVKIVKWAADHEFKTHINVGLDRYPKDMEEILNI